MADGLEAVRVAQAEWQRRTVRQRLAIINKFRLGLVASMDAAVVAAKCDTDRSPLELLTAEVIPLIDACRFLERQAVSILTPRMLGRRHRPLWLVTASSEVRRDPHGLVLLLAPSNYHLFIAGVQTLQALVAGNAVLWKPGRGGTRAANFVRELMLRVGLPAMLLTVLDEAPSAADAALNGAVDKVVMTGSFVTGTAVLQKVAPKVIPGTLELSGHDAVIIRADADIDLVVRGVIFGLLLHRGHTCIAPRRLLVAERIMEPVLNELQARLQLSTPWIVDADSTEDVVAMIDDALKKGARILHGGVDQTGQVLAPLVIVNATPDMRIALNPVFDAVMVVMSVQDDDDALRLEATSPYGLGTAVFSNDEAAALRIAQDLRVGFVSINDLIAPSADPRLPFGGRRQSGYGVTRGWEGLLEMTVPKAITISRGHWRPHFDPPRSGDLQGLKHFVLAVHGRGIWLRAKAFLKLFAALFYANAVEHRRRRLERRQNTSTHQ